MPLSENEMKSQLKEQIDFLKKSCRLYDCGDISEAKNLALRLRVLVYDSKFSKSLLKQMNKKDMLFNDTAYNFDKENPMTHWGLITLSFDDKKSNYTYPLDSRGKFKNRMIPFDKWWKKVIFVDGNRNKMSRKDIVLAVANQDGGAHIDPNLNPDYANLSRHNSLGITYLDINEFKAVPSPESASIRQIAHECLKSLSYEFPEFFINNSIYGLDSSRRFPGNEVKLAMLYIDHGLINDGINELNERIKIRNNDITAHYCLFVAHRINRDFGYADKERNIILKLYESSNYEIDPDFKINRGLTFDLIKIADANKS